MVYRWAYGYSVPGAKEDFVPQNQPQQLRETRAVSITILFVLVPIGAIIAWWLSQQRLTAKPWLEVGASPQRRDCVAEDAVRNETVSPCNLRFAGRFSEIAGRADAIACPVC